MGGRGSDSGEGGDAESKNNPKAWDNESLAAWITEHPDWIKPTPPNPSKSGMARWKNDHPGWGEKTPRENDASKITYDELREQVNTASSADEKKEIIENWIDVNKLGKQTVMTIDLLQGTESFEGIKVRGVWILYHEGDNRIVTAISSMIIEGKIPSRLLEQMNIVILSNQESIEGGSVASKWGDGIVAIYDGYNPETGLIVHEAAHSLAYATYGSLTPPEASDYMATINSGEPPISDYASTGPEEDFAEAVRMYVENPVWLQAHAPKRYKIIRRILNHRRYTG